MANANDIIYSRRNADGTAFVEKTLVPVPNYFVICGPCGDLITFTGSFGGGGTSLGTGSTYPFTASFAISASWAPGGGDFFAQGGNTFTQSGSLGTLDDFDLSIIANNTERMRVNRQDITLYTSGSTESNDLDSIATNSTFDTDLNGWDFIASQWQWANLSGDGSAQHLASSGVGELSQSVTIATNTPYRVWVIRAFGATAGSASVYIGNELIGTVNAAGGVDTTIFPANTGTQKFRIVGSNDFTPGVRSAYLRPWNDVTSTLKMVDADGDTSTEIRARWYGTEYSNLGIGLNSLKWTDGAVYDNIAIGQNTMKFILGTPQTTYNAVIGHESFMWTPDEANNYNNLILGHGVLPYFGDDTYRNIMIGDFILGDATISNYGSTLGNVMVGNWVGRNAYAGFQNNVLIGDDCGYGLLSGSQNVLLGAGASLETYFMSYNIGMGYYALAGNNFDLNFTSSYNVAIGNYALSLLKDSYNIAMGNQAGHYLRSGRHNIAIGNESHEEDNFSLFPATGNHLISLGYRNFFNTTRGSHHLAIGSASFWHGAEGTGSLGIGYETFRNLVTGSNLIALGNKACDTLINANNAVSNSVAIGYSSSFGASGVIALGGTGQHATKVGIGTFTPVTSLHVWGHISASAVTSSLFGTSSYAVSASWAPSAGASIKNGLVSGSSFGGAAELTSSIVFSTPFANNNYTVTITGEDPRSWFVESKTNAGFTINSNSSTGLTGMVFWQTIYSGEYN